MGSTQNGPTHSHSRKARLEMALNYSFKNCDELVLTESHKERWTEFVVFHSMFVGMPSITRENWSQFAMRIMLWSAALNTWQYDASELSAAILPFVGMHTNSVEFTDAKFSRRIREVSEDTMRTMRMGNQKQITISEMAG